MHAVEGGTTYLMGMKYAALCMLTTIVMRELPLTNSKFSVSDEWQHHHFRILPDH